jgi:ribosomal protein L31
MKKDIHADFDPVCFIGASTKKKFLTISTLDLKQKEVTERREHGMIFCDIIPDSHLAYIGKNCFADTAGNVEKFQTKCKGIRK